MENHDANLGALPTHKSSQVEPQLALHLVDCVRLPGQVETTLVAHLENRGTGEALEVRAEVMPAPFADYTLESWRSPIRLAGRLSPGDGQTLEFTVLPKNPHDPFINVTIDVTFQDHQAEKTLCFTLQVPLAKEKSQDTQLQNPYIPGKPLDPRVAGEMSFGRRELVQYIIDNLKGRFQQNILLLHGQRRIGKTSLLLQLRYGRLKPPFYPVFFDIQGLADMGTNLFLYRLEKEIAEALQEFGVNVQTPSRPAVFEGGFSSFNEFLNRVCSELRGGYLVLMFDEFEELESRVRNRKIDRDIFSVIRNQMQHCPWAIFIFAGTHKLEELSSEYFSILFNAVIYREIGYLSENEAEALIREPVLPTLSYENRAVKRIKEVTSFHPYFIQLICFHLVNRANHEGRNRINFQDVDTVVREITTGSIPHLNYLWDQSSPQERTVLCGIAELQRAMLRTKHFPYIEIRREIESMGERLTQSEFSHTLESLIARDLVREAPNIHACGITLELFSHWIREKHPHSLE